MTEEKYRNTSDKSKEIEGVIDGIKGNGCHMYSVLRYNIRSLNSNESRFLGNVIFQWFSTFYFCFTAPFIVGFWRVGCRSFGGLDMLSSTNFM